MVSINARTIVVPLASEQDAEETCAALREHLAPDARVVAVHVIEKAGGAPDAAGVDQRRERADRIFRIVEQRLAPDGVDVETEILYGTDVADTIIDAADEFDADLIAFSPREAGRLSRLLTGDVALDLITKTDRPVLVLPTPELDDKE